MMNSFYRIHIKLNHNMNNAAFKINEMRVIYQLLI